MQMDRSWVEIDTSALKHNFSVFKRAVSRGTIVMPVVKSSAYGHGMTECAKVFEKAGAKWLAVDDIDEALALRKAGIKTKILVLGYTLPARYAEASKKNISITISSLRQFEQLAFSKLALNIHLKVDTGLHRQGIGGEEMDQVADILTKSKVVLEGLYSHFAGAESKRFETFSKLQLKRFQVAIQIFKRKGFNPLTHMSGSAATFCLPNAQFDLVRAGIAIYGLYPSEEAKKCIKGLRPALSWKTIISEVKQVKKGERVGYDLTEKLSRDSTLAVIPVGYWHGLPRSASGRAEVFVRGKRAKIVGRVSMDMTIIDVTDVRGAREGDEVTLIGRGVPAEELADKCGTINYEIVTRVNPLILRILR